MFPGKYHQAGPFSIDMLVYQSVSNGISNRNLNWWIWSSTKHEKVWKVMYPIGSMYDIFTHMYHKNHPNLGKYTSPMGSYGYLFSELPFFKKQTRGFSFRPAMCDLHESRP